MSFSFLFTCFLFISAYVSGSLNNSKKGNIGGRPPNLRGRGRGARPRNSEGIPISVNNQPPPPIVKEGVDWRERYKQVTAKYEALEAENTVLIKKLQDEVMELNNKATLYTELNQQLFDKLETLMQANLEKEKSFSGLANKEELMRKLETQKSKLDTQNSKIEELKDLVEKKDTLIIKYKNGQNACNEEIKGLRSILNKETTANAWQTVNAYINY